MIEKKIKALRDFQFTNFSGTHYFTENEVKVLQFISPRVFEQHLQAGWMVEADPNEPEGKPIAVVYPPKTEDTIVSVSPVDPIDLMEPGSVEPDKPDLPCPPEDHINEIEALDVSKDAGKLPDDVPEDLVHSELSIEEVVPEREEEDQHPKFEDEAGEPEEVVTPEDERRSEPHPEIEEVPVEEISIEEQNENTSELEPGEVVK